MAQTPEDEFSEDDLAVVDEPEFSEGDLSDSQPVAASPAPQQPMPRQPPADPGVLGAIGHNLLSGFFKQGSDETIGVLGRMAGDATVGARYRMPDGTMRNVETGGNMYRAVRDTERETLRGASEHYPWTSTLANFAGDVASDGVLSALGVPVASTPYQVATGALSGLLGNDADLSDGATAQESTSALGNTALGAALGYAAPKVGAAVSRHITPAVMARFRQFLEDTAIKQGRRVLLNGADSLAGNRELAADAVREALETGAIRPFGTTQGAYQNLETIAEMRGANYGTILDRLQAAGVEGPNVESLARQFSEEAADRWANSGANKSIANVFAQEADNIRAVAPPAPGSFSIIGEGSMAATGSRLPPVSGGTPRSPAPAPPPAGPMASPLLTPLPAQKAPTPAFLGGETTRAGRPSARTQAAPSPAPAAPSVDPLIDATPFAPPASRLREAIPGPQVERLPLGQAERIKRTLQDEARWDRLRLTGLDEAKQQVSSTYRQSIEDAIREAGDAAPVGSEVSELASEFLPVKQQLARTLAARDAAERGTAAAAKRRGISLTDYLSAGAAAGGGPAMQLLAAAGNNFARNRGTSAVATGAYGASRLAGRLVDPQSAEAFGNALGAAGGRQLASWVDLRSQVLSNPEAFGEHAQGLAEAAQKGPEAFALHDYMLAQSAPEYAEKRRAALMAASGERP